MWRGSPTEFVGRSIFENTPDIVPIVEVDKRMFWVDLSGRFGNRLATRSN